MKTLFMPALTLALSLCGPLAFAQLPTKTNPVTALPNMASPSNTGLNALPFSKDEKDQMNDMGRSSVIATRADQEVKDGDWTTAVDDYQQAISLWPKNQEALYGMGQYSLTQNKLMDAVGYYRSAMYDATPPPYVGYIDETDARRVMEFALLLSRAGFAEESLNAYRKGATLLNFVDGQQQLQVPLPDFSGGTGQLTLTPAHLQAMADVGWAIGYASFDRQAALAHLQEAIKLAPDSAVAYFYRGRHKASWQADYSAAATDFKKASLLAGPGLSNIIDAQKKFFRGPAATMIKTIVPTKLKPPGNLPAQVDAQSKPKH